MEPENNTPETIIPEETFTIPPLPSDGEIKEKKRNITPALLAIFLVIIAIVVFLIIREEQPSVIIEDGLSLEEKTRILEELRASSQPITLSEEEKMQIMTELTEEESTTLEALPQENNE